MALYLPLVIAETKDLRSLIEAVLIQHQGSFRPEALLLGIRQTLSRFSSFRPAIYHRDRHPSVLEETFKSTCSLDVLEQGEGEQRQVTSTGKILLEQRFRSQYDEAILQELQSFTREVWHQTERYRR